MAKCDVGSAVLVSVVTLACVGSNALAQGSGHPLDGDWRDERNSELSIVVSGEEVTGMYTPELISADCLGGRNKVRGVLSGDIVGLSVVFEKCAVVLSMVGQLTEKAGSATLYVSWMTSNDVQDEFEEQALWASFNFGTSTFTK